jgi:hypothetical protein
MLWGWLFEGKTLGFYLGLEVLLLLLELLLYCVETHYLTHQLFAFVVLV